MKEQELSILEQYHMEIHSTRKIRGAILCDTNEGPYVLEETSLREARAQAVLCLQRLLMENGFENVDLLCENKEGILVTTNEVGSHFLVKKWYAGRECNVRREADVLEAVRNLGKLHLAMQSLFPVLQSRLNDAENCSMCERPLLTDKFEKHGRELNKIRKFMRKKVDKGEFEYLFLKEFEQMKLWEKHAKNALYHTDYENWRKRAIAAGELVHGCYNYHNLIFTDQTLVTVNFHHFAEELQMEDLYYFLRKCMEKQDWNTFLGDKILKAYGKVRPLSEQEMSYLAIRFSYPEKYWKIANSYYQSNKAWISENSTWKLQVELRQMQEKTRFLESIFSFHL